MTRLALPPAGDAEREAALDVLLSPQLAAIVDMVGWSPTPERFEVAAEDGSVRFRRHRRHGRVIFEVESVTGRDPLECQDPGRFPTLEDERADPHPARRDNSYPHAYEQFAQLFDHPSAPDLCVIHSASHNWEDHGGHLGEHGSLGVVQARAPFVASGAGVAALGGVDEACRLVDVAPTILALCGGRPGEETLATHGHDGRPLTELLTGSGARHVVGLLFDGTNANVLYRLAESGGAPNVARLMGEGVYLRHGAVSSLPTVTLANHTSILTGVHPGHHGILHNAWVDRASGRQVVTNSPAAWPTSMQWLSGGAETLYSALRHDLDGAVTAAINEPCDVGADYSTFDLLRRGIDLGRPPGPNDLPDATARFVRPSKDYRWSSRVDHAAVEQFVGLWSGRYAGQDWPRPTFTWVNFTLTDAAFHEGGPYSEMAAAAVADTDARLGRIIAAVETAGRLDETAFILVADHGMGETDRTVRGDWDVALSEAGVQARDEGYGFLYLT